MKKKKRELPFFVLILIIILLVAIPVTMYSLKELDKAKFKSNALKLLDIVKIDVENKNLTNSNKATIYDISSIDNNISNNGMPLNINYNEEIDGNGLIVANNNGKYAINYSNGKWCAYKNYDDNSIKITKGECNANEKINLKCDDLNIKVSSLDEWSQYKTIKINHNSKTCKEVYYRINGGEYKSFENDLEITENSIIDIKTISQFDIEDVQTIKITNIDVTPPEYVTLDVQNVNNKILVTVTSAMDNESGIKGYSFSIDGGNTWTDFTTSNTYTFDKLHQGEYQVQVKAYNGAYSLLGKNEEVVSIVSDAVVLTIDNELDLEDNNEEESNIINENNTQDDKEENELKKNNIVDNLLNLVSTIYNNSLIDNNSKTNDNNNEKDSKVNNNINNLENDATGEDKIQNEEKEEQIEECLTPSIIVNPSGDIWSSNKTVDIIYPNNKNCNSKRYSLDNGESWVPVSGDKVSLSLTENKNIIAFQGSTDKIGKTLTQTIGKIDSIIPTVNVTSATGEKFNSTALFNISCETGNSGIKKYLIEIKNNNQILEIEDLLTSEKAIEYKLNSSKYNLKNDSIITVGVVCTNGANVESEKNIVNIKYFSPTNTPTPTYTPVPTTSCSGSNLNGQYCGRNGRYSCSCTGGTWRCSCYGEDTPTPTKIITTTKRTTTKRTTTKKTTTTTTTMPNCGNLNVICDCTYGECNCYCEPTPTPTPTTTLSCEQLCTQQASYASSSCYGSCHSNAPAGYDCSSSCSGVGTSAYNSCIRNNNCIVPTSSTLIRRFSY